MLATYRELKKGQEDITALDVHLSSCAECRRELAKYDLVGERVRALPTIEPAPDAHTKLMQALAAEHAHFIQRSPSSTVATPAFLVPYLKEQAQKTTHTDAFTAFSTADTGPLPILQTARRRRPFQMNQFAILGIAAAFLMVLMMGGLTSLLLMVNNSISSGVVTSVSVNKPAQVALENYTTTTTYSHVASAVAEQGSIYYTAYRDGSQGWMLEQFDSKTKLSIALLPTESATPLIVLGTSKNWLVWLELGATKPASKHGVSPTANIARSWSLHALPIGTNPVSMPLTLLKDTFDQSTAPAWVHTPVQGVWITENTLLVAALDAKGNAHLWSYSLTPAKIAAPVQIATTNAGHIITSPTSSSDGANIYWSEEWITSDNVLHSNIWTQQTTLVPPLRPGKWAPHTVTSKYQFRADEMSFHPQVVNDMLFFLSTSPNATDGTNGTQATPGASATTQPNAATSVATNVPATPTTARIDPTIYLEQTDASIRGTLLAFSSDGISPIPLNADGQVAEPQGGRGFLLWQDSNNGFAMYDAVAKSPVQVGTVPKNATFLAVNGDTAVWTVNTVNTASNTNATSSSPTVTFSMFTWPSKLATGQ